MREALTSRCSAVSRPACASKSARSPGSQAIRGLNSPSGPDSAAIAVPTHVAREPFCALGGTGDDPIRQAELGPTVTTVLMQENLAEFEQIAPARRRTVGGRTLTLREYVLDAGAREFVVLYWVPPEPGEPILLLHVRIGGQNRFRWTR
jgi:hypothetical protein